MNSSVLSKSDSYVTLALSEQSKVLKCGSKVNNFPCTAMVSGETRFMNLQKIHWLASSKRFSLDITYGSEHLNILKNLE